MAGRDGGVIRRNADIQTQSKRKDEPARALNKLAVTLVSQTSETFAGAVAAGLAELADATGLDRVAMYRNLPQYGHASQFYRWDRESGGTTGTHPSFLDIDYLSTLPDWWDALKGGGCINGPVREMSEQGRSYLASFGCVSAFVAPILLHGEFWGFVSFQDHTRERTFDGETAEALYTAAFLCGGAQRSIDQVREIRETAETLARHDELTGALNRAASSFIEHGGSFETAMTDGLTPIAKMTGVGRVSIFKNFEKDGDKRHKIVFRWALGKGVMPYDANLADLSYANYADGLYSRVMDGQVTGVVGDMYDGARGMFEGYGVKAYMTVPIFKDDEFWGFVMLLNLTEARVYDELVSETLKSAALMCANAYIRHELEEDNAAQRTALRVQLNRQQLLAELSHSMVAAGDAERLVSAALERVGRHLGCSRMVVVEADRVNRVDRLRYAWYADEAWRLRHDVFELQYLIDETLPETLPEDAQQPPVVCSDVLGFEGGRFRVLADLDVKGFVWSGLYKDGELWGLLSAEKCDRAGEWSDDAVRIISLAAGAIGGVVVRDIYDKERSRALQVAVAAKQEAAEAEERARAMLDSAPIGCVLTDAYGNVIDCNEEMLRMLDEPDKTRVLREYASFSPAVQPDGKPSKGQMQSNVAAAMRGERCVVEWMHCTHDGREVPVEITVARIQYGGQALVVGYNYDLRPMRKAEEQARVADERSRTILAGAPMMCVVVDENANMIDCNDATLKLFEVSDKQYYKDNFRKFLPKTQPDGRDSLEKMKDVIRRAISGERVTTEWTHLTDGGEEIPCDATIIQIQYDERTLAIGYLYDMRGIRRMQRDVIEAEERTRVMMEDSPLGCAMTDKDMNVIDCNIALLRLFGCEGAQPREVRFFGLMPKRQPDGRLSARTIYAYINRALSGKRQQFEWTQQKPDGEPVPTEVTLTRVKYRGEYMLIWYYYDLRGVKRMQKQILERDEQLQLQLENQSMLSAISHSFLRVGDTAPMVNEALGRIGRFMSVSRVMVLKLNRENGEAAIPYAWFAEDALALPSVIPSGNIGLVLFSQKIPDAVPVLACNDVRAPESAEYASIEQYGVRAFLWRPMYVHGELWGMVSVEQCGGPRDWTEEESRTVSMFGSFIAGVIIRDIHSKERDAALEAAQIANRAKSVFLANMGHEMRTPMNAIIGMATIGKGAPSAERKDFALDVIQDSSAQLLSVINDVLDMASIETGKLELSPKDFSFKLMLERVITAIGAKAVLKGQSFRPDIDATIPNFVHGDERRLAQVLTCLLTNAVKFTQEGGDVRLLARLETEDGDGVCRVRFEVIDNGIGISPEQQPFLFQPFRQADDASNRAYGGAGLGLAIAK